MLPGITGEEQRDLILSVGTHSVNRRLSPIEVARIFQKSLLAGASLQQCADGVPQLKGTAMVSRFTKLLVLHSDIQHVVHWGQTGATVSFSTASMLTRLREHDQEAVVKAILSHQMRKTEVEQVVQLSQRSTKGLQECLSEVLGMRSVVDQFHLFIGAIEDDRLISALSDRTQRERDAVLESVIAKILGPESGAASRLGADRFTIKLEPKGASALKERLGEAFEEGIVSAVLEEVLK